MPRKKSSIKFANFCCLLPITAEKRSAWCVVAWRAEKQTKATELKKIYDISNCRSSCEPLRRNGGDGFGCQWWRILPLTDQHVLPIRFLPTAFQPTYPRSRWRFVRTDWKVYAVYIKRFNLVLSTLVCTFCFKIRKSSTRMGTWINDLVLYSHFFSQNLSIRVADLFMVVKSWAIKEPPEQKLCSSPRSADTALKLWRRMACLHFWAPNQACSPFLLLRRSCETRSGADLAE